MRIDLILRLTTQKNARPLKYPIFLLTSGETSGEKNFEKKIYCIKSYALNFWADLWGSKPLAHLVVENPEKQVFGQNCPKYDAAVKKIDDHVTSY